MAIKNLDPEDVLERKRRYELARDEFAAKKLSPEQIADLRERMSAPRGSTLNAEAIGELIVQAAAMGAPVDVIEEVADDLDAEDHGDPPDGRVFRNEDADAALARVLAMVEDHDMRTRRYVIHAGLGHLPIFATENFSGRGFDGPFGAANGPDVITIGCECGARLTVSAKFVSYILPAEAHGELARALKAHRPGDFDAMLKFHYREEAVRDLALAKNPLLDAMRKPGFFAKVKKLEKLDAGGIFQVDPDAARRAPWTSEPMAAASTDLDCYRSRAEPRQARYYNSAISGARCSHAMFEDGCTACAADLAAEERRVADLRGGAVHVPHCDEAIRKRAGYGHVGMVLGHRAEATWTDELVGRVNEVARDIEANVEPPPAPVPFRIVERDGDLWFDNAGTGVSVQLTKTGGDGPALRDAAERIAIEGPIALFNLGKPPDGHYAEPTYAGHVHYTCKGWNGVARLPDVLEPDNLVRPADVADLLAAPTPLEVESWRFASGTAEPDPGVVFLNRPGWSPPATKADLPVAVSVGWDPEGE